VKISALARRAGISASGVRWYESAGILPAPPRGANGYRVYTDADLSRLRLVLSLRRLGLSPADAGNLAEGCLDGGVLDPDLVSTLDEQRRRIAAQREELERLEIELNDLETTIDAAGGRRARLTARKQIVVLFVCNGNSARSQIAEALLGRHGGASFEPLSAGTRPKSVHPLTVSVLAEVGIDWSGARAKPVGELLGRRPDYVITLSNEAREDCPTFPGPHSALHWHLEDPAAAVGTEDQRLEAFRATRTELTVRLRPFIEIARRAAGHLPAVSAPASTIAAQGGRP
jgi:arsenate reductase